MPATKQQQASSKQQPGWLSLRTQIIICALLAIGLYANTIGNEYALDDGLVINENPNTKRGLAGLPEIFTSDSYEHYYRQFNKDAELPGGRYRPLSVATFALEWEFFSRTNDQGVEEGNPVIAHTINVLIYALTVALLVFLFNRHWFPTRPMLAFLVAFVFTIHPIHTEAIANIKSRDELLSLLFLVLTLLAAFRLTKSRKTSDMAWIGVFYFLALLSKENGITFLAVVPLSLFVLAKLKWRETLKVSWPLFAVGAVFVYIRYMIVGFGSEAIESVMNDPFLLAASGERIPTIFVTLLQYIKLSFFPHPLAFDYGYRHFAYVTFSDALAASSLLLHLGLLVAGIIGSLRRKVWAFGILFYLITLSIVSNVVFPIGASMGERLIYLSSVGFAIAFAVLLELIAKRIGKPPASVAIVLVPLLVLSAMKIIPRNAEWKNNTTLFIADVSKVPNSVKANVSAATALVSRADEAQDERSKDSLIHSAIQHLERAIELQSDIPRKDHYPDVYLNLGGAYYRLENYILAAEAYMRVMPENQWFRQNDISVSQTFMFASDEALRQGNLADAEAYVQRALIYQPNNADLHLRLGGIYYQKGDYARARSSYEKCTELLPDSPEVWYNFGGFYYTTRDYANAIRAFERTLELQPENEQAQQGLAAARGALGSGR